ncbi:hypothetical protein [Burkholderia cepacia]|uniref:hypothetical protein n=1 Tax=Burkholderia cepacia TaxID=292 RepID=UPI003EE3FDA8
MIVESVLAVASFLMSGRIATEHVLAFFCAFGGLTGGLSLMSLFFRGRWSDHPAGNRLKIILIGTGAAIVLIPMSWLFLRKVEQSSQLPSSFWELYAWAALALCMVWLIAAVLIPFYYNEYARWYVERNIEVPSRMRGFWQCLSYSCAMLVLAVAFIVVAYKNLPVA